ncbi:MAG: hypothetical protein E7322_10030 [Clostridiales bacterium]|nr:hypothetical protein [Clostridiales bacterium]
MYLGVQTFGESLTAWMEEKGLNAPDLAAYLRDTRDATIARLMHDQLDYQRCARFITELAECYPDIDEETLKRLRIAVDVNRYGKEMYLAKQNFFRALSSGEEISDIKSSKANELCDQLLVWSGDSALQLLCIGLTDGEPIRFLNLISEKKKDSFIYHFFYQTRVLEHSLLLTETLPIAFKANYELYEVQDNRGAIMDNLLIAKKDDGEHLLMVYDGGEFSTLHLPKGAELFDFVRKIFLKEHHSPKKINLRFTYNSPEAYLDFLKNCLSLEKNKAIYQIKTEIGLEYIPTDIIYDNFSQWAREHDTRFLPYLETLKGIFEKRYENLLNKAEPTYLIMTKEGMAQFARTGRMKDHPFCMRSFTPAERKRIFQNLIDISLTAPALTPLFFSDDSILPNHSFIGYARECILVCAAQADYDLSDYTEIVLDSGTLSGQYADFVTNILTKNHVLGKKASFEFIQSLIKEIV